MKYEAQQAANRFGVKGSIKTLGIMVHVDYRLTALLPTPLYYCSGIAAAFVEVFCAVREHLRRSTCRGPTSTHVNACTKYCCVLRTPGVLRSL